MPSRREVRKILPTEPIDHEADNRRWHQKRADRVPAQQKPTGEKFPSTEARTGRVKKMIFRCIWEMLSIIKSSLSGKTVINAEFFLSIGTFMAEIICFTCCPYHHYQPHSLHYPQPPYLQVVDFHHTSNHQYHHHQQNVILASCKSNTQQLEKG